MLTIWKYPLDTADELFITMPRDAEILSVQMQGTKPCLWVMVDRRNPEVRRKIVTRPTGHEFLHNDHPPRFIGTYQLQGGRLVFHVFDGGESCV